MVTPRQARKLFEAFFYHQAILKRPKQERFSEHFYHQAIASQPSQATSPLALRTHILVHYLRPKHCKRHRPILLSTNFTPSWKSPTVINSSPYYSVNVKPLDQLHLQCRRNSISSTSKFQMITTCDLISYQHLLQEAMQSSQSIIAFRKFHLRHFRCKESQTVTAPDLLANENYLELYRRSTLQKFLQDRDYRQRERSRGGIGTLTSNLKGGRIKGSTGSREYAGKCANSRLWMLTSHCRDSRAMATVSFLRPTRRLVGDTHDPTSYMQ